MLNKQALVELATQVVEHADTALTVNPEYVWLDRKRDGGRSFKFLLGRATDERTPLFKTDGELNSELVDKVKAGFVGAGCSVKQVVPSAYTSRGVVAMHCITVYLKDD